MLKVLQFIPTLDARDGGTTTYIEQLSPALGALCELHVCCLRPAGGDTSHCVPLRNAEVHFIEIDWLRHRRRMKREWMALLDAVRPDVVHVNCCWLPQCALVMRWFDAWRRAAAASGAAARPLSCLTPHGMLEPWIMKRNYWTRKLPAIVLYQRRAVRRADIVFATADEERRHLAALGWNDRIVMVPNGIDVDAIRLKTAWRAPRRLLFMSRLHPKKGVDILLEAMAMLRTRGLEPQLDIAGEGEAAYTASLQRQAVRLGLTSCVTFLGPVYGPRKWQLLQDADVVVLPSHSENFGLIVAEALATGTPVVTTKGTPWSLLQAEEAGWWVEASPDAVAGAVAGAMSLDAAGAEAMGRRGRSLVDAHYGVGAQARAIIGAYAGGIG